MGTLARVALMVLLCLAGAGCVRRSISVTSDPPGALVWLNDQEVGRTPLTHEFTWYGTYDVRVRRDGYASQTDRLRVAAPWWQIPPIDLLAELFPLRDRRTAHYTLAPASTQPAEVAALMARGIELSGQLGSSRSAPSTQPTAQPPETTTEAPGTTTDPPETTMEASETTIEAPVTTPEGR